MPTPNLPPGFDFTDPDIYTERLPNPGETLHGEGFAVNPGGKSANQAVAAARAR